MEDAKWEMGNGIGEQENMECEMGNVKNWEMGNTNGNGDSNQRLRRMEIGNGKWKWELGML